jgi:hypothetical protein
MKYRTLLGVLCPEGSGGEGREEEERGKERVLSVAQWKERAWRSESF